MTDQDYIAEHAAQCDADEREFHEAGLRALGPKPQSKSTAKLLPAAMMWAGRVIESLAEADKQEWTLSELEVALEAVAAGFAEPEPTSKGRTAAECLRQPGDVARRESDGAVAVWMYEFGSDPPRIVVMKPHDRSWWPPGQAIPGDDWQPLHPAGEGDWMARAYGAESVVKCEQQKNAELAAEVKRLTAERDNLRKEAEIQAQEARTQSHTVRECYAAVGANHRGDWHGAQPIRDKINALTARVAELEASIEKFGSCIFNTRGDLEHVELGTDQLNALMAEFVRHFPSPLPTAGDGAPKVSEPGNPGPPPPGYRGAYVPHRMVKSVPCSPDCAPAPAEPDSPAEEPRKPDCLDGVPAVLCEHEYKRKVWVYGPISDGWMACWVVDQQRDCERHVELIAAEFLTPIHHDPTDAAAVELAARIAEGGNRG